MARLKEASSEGVQQQAATLTCTSAIHPFPTIARQEAAYCSHLGDVGKGFLELKNALKCMPLAQPE